MCVKCTPITDPANINRPAMLEWINALESGIYPQATGKLVMVDDGETVGYCCLGVATEIFANRCGITSRVKSDMTCLTFEWTTPGDVAVQTTLMLPDPVATLLGLAVSSSAHAGDVSVAIHREEWEPERENLSTLNDGWGWDFTQIAATLRANFLPDTIVHNTDV